jgi:hypothetical protein
MSPNVAKNLLYSIPALFQSVVSTTIVLSVFATRGTTRKIIMREIGEDFRSAR